jgi:glutamate N-acetyltransferase/amino-acid N-acetyltransferase
MIVMDGEGATKFVEVHVKGAASEEEAERAARAVANSNLVKTARSTVRMQTGEDLAAIGYSGIDFRPEDVEILFGDVDSRQMLRAGIFRSRCEARPSAKKEITITVDLNQGRRLCFILDV